MSYFANWTRARERGEGHWDLHIVDQDGVMPSREIGFRFPLIDARVDFKFQTEVAVKEMAKLQAQWDNRDSLAESAAVQGLNEGIRQAIYSIKQAVSYRDSVELRSVLAALEKYAGAK